MSRRPPRSPSRPEARPADRWRRTAGAGLGKQPIGLRSSRRTSSSSLAVFAYPLGFAVYMSFHDYFFAAPGAIVDRPFVGFDNYVDGADGPGGPAVVRATSASS